MEQITPEQFIEKYQITQTITVVQVGLDMKEIKEFLHVGAHEIALPSYRARWDALEPGVIDTLGSLVVAAMNAYAGMEEMAEVIGTTDEYEVRRVREQCLWAVAELTRVFGEKDADKLMYEIDF